MFTRLIEPKPETCDCADGRYSCCDCGGESCGCAYCWSCNACDDCKGDRE